MAVSKGAVLLAACKDNLVASQICITDNEFFSILPMIDIFVVEIGKGHKRWFIILVYIPPKITAE